MNEQQKFLQALEVFARAFQDVSDKWTELTPVVAESVQDAAGYPFAYSFDEMAAEVQQWTKNVAEGLTTKKFVRISCDQCNAAMINGIFAHETGCPNSRKTWVADREQWVKFVECDICGCEVEEGEQCDCMEDDAN